MKQPAELFITSTPNQKPVNLVSFSQSSSPHKIQRVRVGQDKRPRQRAAAGTIYPAAPPKPLRGTAAPTPSVHSPAARNQRRSGTRRHDRVTLWLEPAIAAELRRVAAQEQLSISATGQALLVSALRKNLQEQNTALLQPVIEHTIQEQMQQVSTRLAALLVRILYSTGQTRRLVVNILGRQDNKHTMSETMLNHIVDSANDAARKDLSRRSPQLKTIEQELATWLREEDASR